MDNTRYLSPKETCKILGVHYKTLYNWADKGLIEVLRLPGGKRMYNVEDFVSKHSNAPKKNKRNICYCRVSTHGQKPNLIRQIEYMKENYPQYEIIKDVGSGMNFKRRGFKKIIKFAINGEINELVVAYKDRLCRFGYEMIKDLINEYSKGKIIVLNKTDLSPTEEMTRDIVSIINIFNKRINGLRKYKKKIMNITK